MTRTNAEIAQRVSHTASDLFADCDSCMSQRNIFRIITHYFHEYFRALVTELKSIIAFKSNDAKYKTVVPSKYSISEKKWSLQNCLNGYSNNGKESPSPTPRN